MKTNKKMFFALSIAVFALFFSCKDEKAAETPTTPATQNTNTVNSTNTNNGTVALNPAHGQPGHRCDIPVGQPLDGSSTTNSQTISTQTSPVINNSISPIINTSTSTNTTTTNTSNNTNTGNLNPAHGQPGHRCDIPVGQPLN